MFITGYHIAAHYLKPANVYKMKPETIPPAHLLQIQSVAEEVHTWTMNKQAAASRAMACFTATVAKTGAYTVNDERGQIRPMWQGVKELPTDGSKDGLWWAQWVGQANADTADLFKVEHAVGAMRLSEADCERALSFPGVVSEGRVLGRRNA